MKEIILLRGIPGCGKTTIANKFSGILVEANHFFYDEKGNYNFDVKLISEAHKFCQNKVASLMNLNSRLIIVSNTFIEEWELEPYFILANKYGYTISSLIVENRHNSDSIHSVSLERRMEMKDKLMLNIKLI